MPPEYYWENYTGETTDEAYEVEDNIYIAQIIYGKGQLVGTFYANDAKAISSYWGKKIETTSGFKILCTPEPDSFEWRHINAADLEGTVLNGCVEGGFEDGSALYIGKIFHEGIWKVSKVFPVGSRFNGLKAWYNVGSLLRVSQTYTASDFQILMYSNPKLLQQN